MNPNEFTTDYNHKQDNEDQKESWNKYENKKSNMKENKREKTNRQNINYFPFYRTLSKVRLFL